MNPYKAMEESSFVASPHITYEDIASKLLKDNYFLTALELHTELVESGKELPQLREFFSNPGNFEQHAPRSIEYSSMQRTPSQATLDSLDTARYSEDGGGDRGGSGGDLAVLEFELRKARETINSLKANLTQFADGDSALDKTSRDNHNQRVLKPHEKRALNFLINEYLLLQDYKLTSITFSDENPDQDFEDWDDVGLIMPRPSGLVSFFWGNTNMNTVTVDVSTSMDAESLDVDCQTPTPDHVCVSCQTNNVGADLSQELIVQAEEIAVLKENIIALETEKLNFQKLYDAAIVSLNSLTTPTSESRALELNMPEKLQAKIDSQPITCMATENHYGSSNSTHSATPEQFEMIYGEKPVDITKKASSTASSYDHGVTCDNSTKDSPLRRGSVTTLEETLSINDGQEWTKVQYDYNSIENNGKDMWIDSGIPNNIKVSILNWCCETLDIKEPISNDLLAELISCDKPITLPGLLVLVADTLPRIIPHTLVSRRCEAAALISCTIHLLTANDEGTRRAKLLQLLLTLLKKPDPSEIRIICEAACLIVKWGGSWEVLSSIAELITSRSSERRVLASQICVSIAPYVSIELCTSLLFSLVTLMCESNEVEVRSLGLKSACLVCPVAEHKYSQLEAIMFNFLKDTAEKNIKDTVNIFVPVLARSALNAGKFSSDFISKILGNLIKASEDKDYKTVLLHLEILRVVVLAQIAYVLNVQILKDNDCDTQIVNYQEVPLKSEEECFLDLQCYVSDCDAKSLLVSASSLLKQKPDVRWTELNWFEDLIKKILETATNLRSLNQTSIYTEMILLFNTYVENCGSYIATSILRPIFLEFIVDLEQKMEKLLAINIDSTVIVGIYFVTVLPALGDDKETESFLQKWIMYSSIRSLPVRVFSIPFKWMSRYKPELLSVYLKYLREFSASSCESQSGVVIRVFIANLISEVINSSSISESCVEAQLLPAVLSLIHDGDVSVREAALTCWGVLTRYCGTQKLKCEELCWSAMQQIVDENTLSVKETARMAESLALLILPVGDNTNGVVDNAVNLLCMLCHRAPLSNESLSALTPGLQLVAHHARNHSLLLPALRKLEEGVQTPSLAQYKQSIEALIQNVATPSTDTISSQKQTASNLLSAQEAVGRRVTQIFQQSKTNMNLQNIFKKKP